MRLVAHTVPRRTQTLCASLQVLADATECDKWRKAQREDLSHSHHPVARNWLGYPIWGLVVADIPVTKCLVDQWETLQMDERGVLVKLWVALGDSTGWACVVTCLSGVERVMCVVRRRLLLYSNSI